MMHNRLHFFRECLELYQNQKELFGRFCETCRGSLNDNEQYSGTSFTVSEDGSTATLCAMDRTFNIRFHIELDDMHSLGVLKISLESGRDTDDVLLFHLYFDNLGNVKESADATSTANALHEKEFLRLLLNQLATRYLKHEKKMLDDSL